MLISIGILVATSFSFKCTAANDLNSLLSDQWIHTEWNHVTVVSNASRKDTEVITTGVADFLDHIAKVLPYPTREDHWPLRIYVCKDNETFAMLAPPGLKYQNDVSGVFTQGLGYDVILVLADAHKTRLRTVLYHELVHREMRSQGDIPLWLDEGFAEVFSMFRIKQKSLQYGLSDSKHRHWIQRNEPTTFNRLFHVTHGSPEYNERTLSGGFYATAWIFTHYAFFADNGAYKDRFFHFIEAARKQVVTETLFKRHFEMSYDEMTDRLNKYARSFRFPKGEIRLTPNNSKRSFEWTQTESRISELLLTGAKTLSGKFADSHNILNDLSEPTDFQTTTELANLEQMEKATLAFYEYDFEKAQRIALSAYRNGNRSPTTLLLTAQGLLQVIPGQRVYYNLVVPLPEVNQAFRCINQLLTFAPRNPLACRLYALAWIRTNSEPSPAQYRKLMDNARTLGDDSEIAFLTADLMIFHRKYRNAKAILEYFRDHTYSKQARDEAIERLQKLP